MRDSVSFRTILILSLWGLLALTLIFPSWYAYTKLHYGIHNEVKQNLTQQLNLVCSLMAQHEEFQNPEQLQEWILAIAKPLNLRVTYVAYNGQVLADSMVPFDQIKDLEDFSGRPEISQALHDEIGFMTRFSKITGSEQVFAARSIQPRDGIPAGVIRVAAPVAEIQGLVERLRNLFFLIVPLAFVAAAWLSHFLIRRLKKDLGSVAQAVESIGEGDTRQHIHFTPGEELYALADTINRMAENTGRRFLALTAQRQELDAVFNAMRDGVMVLDSKGRIQGVNRALSELLGAQERSWGVALLKLFSVWSFRKPVIVFWLQKISISSLILLSTCLFSSETTALLRSTSFACRTRMRTAGQWSSFTT